VHGKNDFKQVYQTRANILNDEKGDLVCRLSQYFGSVEKYFPSAIECTWG
jgi:hypothetical protein